MNLPKGDGHDLEAASTSGVVEAVPSQAELLIEGAIRMADSDIDRTQGILVDKIEEAAVAQRNVEFWKTELNALVAKQQELEESLRRLRA